MKPDRTPMPRRPRVPPNKPRLGGGVGGDQRSVEQDPVEVFCRIRPPEDGVVEECVAEVDDRTLKLTPPSSSFAFRNGSGKEQLYKFERVFGPAASQKELFTRVALPLVSDLVSGRNGLLFAYGVTGSGKTYTMQGTPQDGGIVRRTLDVVFNSIQSYQAGRFIFRPDGMNGFDAQSELEAQNDRRKATATPRPRMGYTATTRGMRTRREAVGGGSSSQDSSQRIPDTSRIDSLDEDNVFAVYISYVEIYNNYIYDLLEEIPEIGPPRGLQTKIIREDPQHNMYVHACSEVEVKSPEDGLEVMYRGLKRRKTACTHLNCESSRSHSIFTIRVVQAPLDAQGEDVVTDKNAMLVSQLSLVDLAGSERNLRTKAVGDRIKEAGNINNSLMNLRTCIEILRENQSTGGSKKVPYRDSKLTHYFKNFFEGNGKIRMVVCVNPRAEDYDETLTVMKFAELASEVQIQRSEPQRLNHLGLPKGRRRANQLFKEVRRKLEDEVGSAAVTQGLELDISPIYTLAPEWPSVTCGSGKGLEDVVACLKAYLRRRLASRERLDLRERILSVHNRCLEVEKENLVMRQELASLRALHSDAISRIRTLETHVHNAESANDSLQRQLRNYTNLRDECEAVKEERDMARAQSHIEKQRMRAKLRNKLEQEKVKLKSTLNTELCNQKSKIYQTQVKVLQEVLFNGKPSATTTTASSSDTDLPSLPPDTPIKPSISDPKLTMTPAPQRSTPVVNLRHRRSRSQGADTWIDHRPLKGEVLPTAGGGAQVVLRDVEILQQVDPLDHHHTPTSTGPTTRKRSSTSGVDTPTLQERCSWGVQGGGGGDAGSVKRPRI